MSGSPGEQRKDIKLDFTKKAKDEGGETGSYISGGVTITVTKNNLGNGFFKRVHQPNKTLDFSGAFSNSFYERIGNGTTTLKDLKTATFYFWEKEETNPLFLEVTLQGGKKPQYYYKYAEDEPEVKDTDAKTWTHNRDTGLQLEDRLDDRNCGVNKAIAYDLRKDYSTEGVGATRSTCLNSTRKITKSASPPPKEPLGGSYTLKEYDVTPDTRISRVTFGSSETDGINPPTDATSQIRVYYWAHGKTEHNEIPLLIEFRKSHSGSDWFENTDKTSLKWKSVGGDTTKFYDQQGTQPKPALTTKLDYVNCTVNGVTVIDIGKKPKDKYCHDPNGDVGEDSHTSLIKVEDITKTDLTYKDKIGKFVVYEHAVDPKVSGQRSFGDKFHISGFTKDGQSITLTGEPQPSLPFLNVSKFLVFWCGSGSKAQPLLFYIEYNDNQQKREWFKKPKNGDSTNKWIKLEDTGKPNTTKAIWDILNSYETECKFKWWHIITGTAGGGATGGVGYWAYKGFEWFFMAPWPRLM